MKIKKTSLDKKFYTVPLVDIKSVFDGSKLEFLVLPIKDNTSKEFVFAKKVAKGAINLFKGKSSKGNDIYFLNSIKIPRTIQIHPKGVNSFIKNLFQDCPRKEERIYYKYSDIINALGYYHECLYPDEIFKILEKPNNTFTFGIGYKGMYFTSDLDFPSDSYYAQSNFISEARGGFGVFLKTYLNEKWSIQLGANYLRYQFVDKAFTNPRGETSVIDLEVKMIEVPLEVTYYFDIPFEPHLILGASVDFLINPRFIETPVSSSFEAPRVNFNNENYGVYFGMGLRKKVNPKAEVLLQIKYFREGIRMKTNFFDQKRQDFILREDRLNPNRIEISANYVFLIKK